jgi:hypothetical protein
MQTSKDAWDVSKIFLTYSAFGGDVQRTAYALEMPVETVRDFAVSEQWESKLAELTKAKGDSKEAQIQINRAINFVQATRLRSVLDKVLSQLTGKTGEELVELLTVVRSSESGSSSEIKMRPLTDLVKALESTQLMTARALGDTEAERPKDTGEQKGSSIALKVLAAMNAADELGVDSVSVVRKQIEQETGKSV